MFPSKIRCFFPWTFQRKNWWSRKSNRIHLPTLVVENQTHSESRKKAHGLKVKYGYSESPDMGSALKKKSPPQKKCCSTTTPNKWYYSWWFQPIWKILYSQTGSFLQGVQDTLPKSNSEFTPENGWLEDDPFLFGARPIFRGKKLVSGRVSLYR